jgi:Leucine Rich repeat
LIGDWLNYFKGRAKHKRLHSDARWSSMTSMDQPPANRRRWLRFSLRTLLVVMTVLCVWLGFKVNAARRQKEAVEAIIKAGGTVTFGYQCVPVRGNPDALALDPNALPNAPAWLRTCLGDDFFRTADEVILNGRAISDEDLAQTMNLPGIWYLFLTDVKVVRVDSDNQRLIQDADLVGLGQLGELRRLALGKADINGFGLASLVNLKHLKSLNVVNTHVDDSGMEYIGRIVPLADLNVGGTRISDSGLKQLRSLTNLKALNLDDTDISDAGLEYLKVLTNLTNLDLSGTRVTTQGIRELQKALPNTKITGP